MTENRPPLVRSKIIDISMSYYSGVHFRDLCDKCHRLIIYPLDNGRWWKYCPICGQNQLVESNDEFLMFWEDGAIWQA
jgi:RNA polymerase subunit RPABC4/transcription elongation factor Spt4